MNDSEYPLLSLRERDRRWDDVRTRMSEHHLDALLIWGNNRKWGSGLANLRYVTHVGCKEGVAVFPREDEPVCFATQPHYFRPRNYLTEVQDWVEDVRPFSGVEGLVDAITSLGLESGRIGYIDRASLLGGFAMPYTPFTRVRNLLPDVSFSDETSMFDELRMIKSDEEIGFLRRSGTIASAMIDSMIETAEPGVAESAVYGEMVKTLVTHGGEDYGMIQLVSDSLSSHRALLLHAKEAPLCPSSRVLETGDLLMCEIHANYGGYLTGAETTISLGSPPSQLLDIYEICSESSREGLSKMKPGETLQNCVRGFLQPVKEAGMDIVELGFHGHGLSSPEHPTCVLPDYVPSQSQMESMRIEENMVFATNIDIFDPDWRSDVGVMFGATYFVTDSGAKPLVELDSQWVSVNH